ncbi:ATP-dependent helicase [Pengzhenrongella frigida]|uniref:DNA 3'-5' helicase n=1 Tax=Pengzhenrongella frigida TaxID=1259133 RepID=A0A4V1ZH13_9MICO|nr:ATP-dependent DNA helicase [Cellulomonas sp. HLT2-17]RYV50444.1 ATP-dependent helicase [Cellulomonas sp. HLT2-17]
MTLSAVRIAELLGRAAPTADQVEIIESPLSPLLVVAGAGSGKTETMAARVVWLIANGLVVPEQVLGLTFTRKAAGELGDRIRLRLRRLAAVRPAHGSQQGPDRGSHQGPDRGSNQGPDRGSDRRPGLDLARPTVATYNSYAASLVTDHALRLGIEPTSRLLREAGQWQLATEVVETWAGDLATDAATSSIVQAVLSLSGALAEHLLEPDAASTQIEAMIEELLAVPDAGAKKGPYAATGKVIRSLAERGRLLELVIAYRRRKRDADVIDFGDQVSIAARLAREVEAVGQTERDRFRVVLLDEYQDTSHAQLELLSALFGGGHPVTAVGDPHQSIYGWRGASAGGLERFPDRFPVLTVDGPQPAPVRFLATSWRNDRAILAAANLVAAPLRARAVEPAASMAAGSIAAASSLVAASSAASSAAAAESAPTRVQVPQLEARPGAGPGAVYGVYAITIELEAAAVARFVKDHWRPNHATSGRVTAAVLCRKRSQFAALETALRAAGLPVEVVGLGGLLQTPEVVDLVAALRVAHDPSRGDALIRLLTGARTRLGIADLHALAAWAGELADSRGGPPRPVRGSAPAAEPESAKPESAERDRVDRDLVEGDVVDERSIVDALDDLPRRGWRSRTGRHLTDAAHGRLVDLADLLRTLRSHTYLSLSELVGEAERLLGLDIEVASRPGVSPGRARAHLDAFRDVAVQFSDGADTPTLGAFLAWLDAAASEERGLERPLAEPDPDAVQLITVHAAKGLEWDVVAVPGLTDGVLPSTATSGKHGPRESGWLGGLGTLPYPLRGDAAELPVWAVADAVDQKDLDVRREQLRSAIGAHQVAEERRLAYVAFTRARRALLLSGSWWLDRQDPQPPSLFLAELVDAGLVRTDGWADRPDDDAANPRTAEPVTQGWPTDPFGPGDRRAHVTAAAAAVDAELAAGRTVAVGPDPTSAPPTPAPPTPSPLTRTATLLLEERARVAAPAGGVELPAHLSASAVVRLAADPQAFAHALRRPVPLEPSVQARRGTAFHAWVEQYYGSASLVDVESLPGADDDSVAVDGSLADLRAAFLATPWAGRTPVAVEVDIETPVAGYVLRCRIDAVFSAPDGGVVVVDWKTGRPPLDEAAARTREVQLAVYRLAWSRWSGLPLARVDAAFCYVGAGLTVTPERLLDEAGIEALLRDATT